MSMYTLLEVNNDHIDELASNPGLGDCIMRMCRTPHNAQQIRWDYDIVNVIRVVGQTGEHTYADDIKQCWLWKPDTLLRDTVRNKPEDKSGVNKPFAGWIAIFPDLEQYVEDMLTYYGMNRATFAVLSSAAKIALSEGYDKFVKAAALAKGYSK